ncbi:nickel/cobalt transporter [Pseudochrobactrum sp. XF203]|uniref:nickel/cobalt transporter n=1 Tax=Pseudochrobactrum sp. XF203 TaxID=2879116 RepID=UPI001CE2E8CF|nr:nickel/cobalt transporter [Pseudochrobactrum sp. XF203]UCA44948.1 nickel/cobalt transporter [Pseudochrobactrum sp. XF203]
MNHAKQHTLTLPPLRACALLLTICTCLLFVLHSQAWAQSSLGIGASEVTLQPTGPFAKLILWINAEQKRFYLMMTTALKAMKDDPWAAWTLVSLSFLYGILHAAGPGHGKAVISSYMIANETALRRGIFLSFISSVLQALSAIFLVGMAWFVLRGIGISMGKAGRGMEIASYVLVILCGIYIIFRKLRSKQQPVPAIAVETMAPAPVWQGSLSASATQKPSALNTSMRLKYQPANAKPAVFDHEFSGDGANCTACGHSHLADPSTLSGDFNWKTAWAAIIAVGIRPCSGAIIVLTFSMLNGLMLGGILSAFAMAFGTFITVALLATLAVTAKNTALRLVKNPLLSARLQTAIEIAAALFIILTGVLLLIAALS